jgi:lipopolysaccharide export system permease protein
MSTIAGFLTRMILMRFATILLGITAFVLTLEVVGYVSDILALDSNAFSSIGQYALMRSPAILSTFLPMSLLLALLLTVTELTYRNEMAAIFAAGVSPLRLILMLLPVALVTGGHWRLCSQEIKREPNRSDLDQVWHGHYARYKSERRFKIVARHNCVQAR